VTVVRLAGAGPLAEDGDRVLAREELAIARRFVGGVPWIIVVWGLGNFFVWLSLWPLVLMGVLPLWLACPIAILCTTICYLPSHEAQHSNIAAPGARLRWLNELVGYVSTVPLVLPFKLARLTHMEHHSHTNDPALDPDYGAKAPNWIGAIVASIANRQPRAMGAYQRTAEHIGGEVGRRAILEALITTKFHYFVLCAVAWVGYPLEALLIWWLPRQFALTYVQVLLSWAPHHPMIETGRYRDTRAWRFPLGNLFALGMEYHIVHHLHPAIPITRNRAAYLALRHVLLQRNCRIEGR